MQSAIQAQEQGGLTEYGMTLVIPKANKDSIFYWHMFVAINIA